MLKQWIFQNMTSEVTRTSLEGADADVRLARRIRRDTGEKGRNIGMVLDQYSKFVKTAFDDFILPTKKYADIIIPRGGDNHIRGMHTLIRDAQTTKHDFVFYLYRLIRLVVEHGLGHLPFPEKQVITPTGSVYTGVDFCKRLCGVSVMLLEVRACCKGIKIEKILIHREGDNGQQARVVVGSYILGTGNSAVQTISLLLKKGVPEANIIFLNLEVFLYFNGDNLLLDGQHSDNQVTVSLHNEHHLRYNVGPMFPSLDRNALFTFLSLSITSYLLFDYLREDQFHCRPLPLRFRRSPSSFYCFQRPYSPEIAVLSPPPIFFNRSVF
ncbi:unnamed protein product [Lactuca virosa]|uniref:Phosphoribosyltransferase domain-containing protein n=1 Tax=Lactuca virosa TaxID=75947 RepID=A0AAU9MTK8_9ASTR|nr:unnamed protein product [Lactuca virosa]